MLPGKNMASMQRVIAVIGATGTQGGAVVSALLKSGQFAVRGLTRDPNSEKAQTRKSELQTLFPEANLSFVKADMDDVTTLEAAFDGCYGVFGVTNFWEHMSPEREYAQANNMAVAAQKTKIEHFVWSTLDDARKYIGERTDFPTLMKKYKVPHFDAKAEADALFSGKYGVPTTFLLTSFYWTNFVYFGMGPKKVSGEEDKYAITLPLGGSDKKLFGCMPSTIGQVTAAIFQRGPTPDLLNKYVSACDEHLSGDEIAQRMSAALNKDIVYNSVPPETFAQFGFPGAEDLANMFKFFTEYQKELLESRDVENSAALCQGFAGDKDGCFGDGFGAFLKEFGSKITFE